MIFRLALALVVSLQWVLGGYVHAQVSSSFPYIYQGDSSTSVVLNDLSITEDGSVIGVGYVDYNADTTASFDWMRSLIVKLGSGGELLWEKVHRIGSNSSNGNFYHNSKFNCILPYEDGFLVGGEAIIDGNLGNRMVICSIDLQGDTIWCKNYGLPQRNVFLHSMMFHDNQVILSGSVAQPFNSPNQQDGLVIRCSTSGELIDMNIQDSYYDADHFAGLSFTGMDIDGNGQALLIGKKIVQNISNGTGHFFFQLYNLADEGLSLISEDTLPLWRLPEIWVGSVSDGHRSYSDTTVIYGVDRYPSDFPNHLVRAETTINGTTYTTINSNFLPPDHVIDAVHGAVHYGMMDFVYGRYWNVGTAQHDLFAVALNRESSQPVWSFLSPLYDSFETYGISPIRLDSANGIATLSGRSILGMFSDPFTHNTIFRFDLRRIYPYLLTAESLKSKEHINLWPNPFDEQLQLNILNGSITYDVTISDMLGQQLMAKQLNYQNPSIATDHLPAGLYVVTVTDDSGSAVSQRMVKLNR